MNTKLLTKYNIISGFFATFLFFAPNISFAQTAPALQELKSAPEDLDAYDEEAFKKWVEKFKTRAIKKYKISEATVNEAFKDIKYNQNVISADRKQPEFMKTFWKYSDSALRPDRIANGKIMLKRYRTLLKTVSDTYGVPPEILVAFWGLETNYGNIMGTYDIIEALTTLAFDPRRSEFFTTELIKALKIIDSGYMTRRMLKGSWAGAFGNFQFLPSTFERYAIDGNNDGRKNITGDIVDAMHSAGNYLSKMGWDKKIKWGIPVIVKPNNKDAWKLVNSGEWHPQEYFAKLGITTIDEKPLTITDTNASLVAPNGVDGPTFLVYNNFKYIMNWNASTNYALSVGLLSDALTSHSVPLFDRPTDWDKRPVMTTNQIKDIQEYLASLDIYDAKISGLYGKKTMKAIKKYQQLLLDGDKRVSKDGSEITTYPSGNPVITDGYPSFDLYEIMFSHNGEVELYSSDSTTAQSRARAKKTSTTNKEK